MIVMTMNCLLPQYAKSSGLPAKPWSVREPLLADLIVASGASAVACQEITPASAAALAARLGAGWRSAGSGLNAVIWNTAKLTALTTESVQLYGSDDRRAIAVVFQEGLTFCAAHLSHRNSCPGKSEVRAVAYRRKQAAEVADFVRRLAPAGTVAVVGADLNSTAKSTPNFPRAILAKAGFVHLRQALGGAVVNGKANSVHGFKKQKYSGSWLDDILTLNGKVTAARLRLSGQATDHNAIEASVDLRVPATLRLGATGRVVKALQKSLGIVADGIWGPATDAAVKAFQKTNRLDPDGVVGPLTWAKLPSVRY